MQIWTRNIQSTTSIQSKDMSHDCKPNHNRGYFYMGIIRNQLVILILMIPYKPPNANESFFYFSDSLA